MSELTTLPISHATLGALQVVTPEGSLTHPHAPALKAALDQAASGHEPLVALNLQSVSFMDSATLQVIVDAVRALQAKGGRLKLVRPNDVCLDILRATRLLFEVEVCKDLNEAVKNGGA